MADLFVRHSLNSRKTIRINIALREFVVLADQDGDTKWILEIGTTDLDALGNFIRPQMVHNISESNIEDEVEKAIANICSVIDWSDLEQDKEAPRISYFYPSGNDIPIDSLVTIDLIEDLPSSGIDLSEMKIVLNNGVIDFDITSEIDITGDPYQYKIIWRSPNIRG